MIRALLLLSLALAGCQAGPKPELLEPVPPPPMKLKVDAGLQLEAKGTELRWKADEKATLMISTSQAAYPGSDPIRELPLGSKSGRWVDPDAPDGVTCYYRVRSGERISNEVAIEWPDRPLPALFEPSILVDKPNYYLEVRDKNVPVKRYPIAMGKKCQSRKVCYDNASTPEGRYRIVTLQPEATYYRAYDIDYPNAHDRERYEFYRQNGLIEADRDIGGEIQVHGQGISRNWTFGCIALRNEDMDELFAHPEIAVGTPITIVGQQLRQADLQAIDEADPNAVALALQAALGPEAGNDARSLGRFQLERKLPVSCLPDLRTLEALGLKSEKPGARAELLYVPAISYLKR